MRQVPDTALHRTHQTRPAGQLEREMAENPREILLVYDEECPVCDAYCHMVRIRESVGMLRLVNARNASAVMEEITRQDLDIDQGMVLKVDDVLYYGCDAMHALSLMSSRSGVFNRVDYWVFRSKTRSRILYPVFRSCLNLLLKTLQKTRINNLGLPHNDRF
jgi:predicted DCC family thiol-disulfide oxidoreductase YuxK